MSHGSRVGPECDTDRPCRFVMTGCECYCIVHWSRSAGCRLLKQYKIHFLPIVPDFRKSIFLRLPGFDRWMMLSGERRWHDTDGGGPTYCNRNLPPPLLAPHMSLDWPEIEPRPRQWEAWAWTLSDSSECYYSSHCAVNIDLCSWSVNAQSTSRCWLGGSCGIRKYAVRRNRVCIVKAGGTCSYHSVFECHLTMCV